MCTSRLIPRGQLTPPGWQSPKRRGDGRVAPPPTTLFASRSARDGVSGHADIGGTYRLKSREARSEKAGDLLRSRVATARRQPFAPTTQRLVPPELWWVSVL